MLTRDHALELLQAHVPQKSLINHCLESEAVLKALAREKGQDEAVWGMAGLLHDLDYSMVADTPEQHGMVGADMLEGQLPDEALHAIRAHNDMTGVEPETDLDFALRCGETVTGLIHTAALVRPTRMQGMKAKSLKKKMKDKAFAASVNRDVIRECDKIGLELGAFLTLAIGAVAEIAPQVGLVVEE
ncbi:HD domain-containing protein [Desulfoplanes formicivorans]|uniref:HD family phosphohydrolase n=1 Tax=Desulfoplanes formicivorans TaxID=1592317 RepID=A0A194AFT5_9BACT|nr:HD domain-containing protein [Desulfoplanes formicivorans]GAU08193.1 HD family phosphohydrolase [Desulfoplanes formicivorans]